MKDHVDNRILYKLDTAFVPKSAANMELQTFGGIIASSAETRDEVAKKHHLQPFDSGWAHTASRI